jgi:predicted ArsR family transcriptional regulator
MSTLPSTDEHAAALASPARRRVLSLVRTAPQPPTAQQLAADLGVHVTTVRFHLDHLEAAGLVGRETRHSPRRGRPAVHYVPLGGDPVDAREQMISTLAHALATGTAPASGPHAAREAGRRWAHRVEVHERRPQDAVVAELTRLGFDPAPDPDDAQAVQLRACPFRDAAREHPEIVCQTHLGLAEGLVERTAPGTPVGLHPFVRPDLCVLTLGRTTPTP